MTPEDLKAFFEKYMGGWDPAKDEDESAFPLLQHHNCRCTLVFMSSWYFTPPDPWPKTDPHSLSLRMDKEFFDR